MSDDKTRKAAPKVTLNLGRLGSLILPDEFDCEVSELFGAQVVRDETVEKIYGLISKHKITGGRLPEIMANAIYENKMDSLIERDETGQIDLFAEQSYAALHKNFHVRRGAFTLDHHRMRGNFLWKLLEDHINAAGREIVTFINPGIVALTGKPPDTTRSEVKNIPRPVYKPQTFEAIKNQFHFGF